jgi:hypothetical protein
LQARQCGECMLLFKTVNRFAPLNRCASVQILGFPETN